jgi:hypothetical protein
VYQADCWCRELLLLLLLLLLLQLDPAVAAQSTCHWQMPQARCRCAVTRPQKQLAVLLIRCWPCLQACHATAGVLQAAWCPAAAQQLQHTPLLLQLQLLLGTCGLCCCKQTPHRALQQQQQ